MRTLSFVVASLLLTSTALGERRVTESRYIEYQSQYSIVRIILQLGSGITEDAQLLTDLFSDESDDLSKIGELGVDIYRTFRIDIDGRRCDCSFRTLADVYKHIKGYVLNRKTDGSIFYSYSFTYNDIRVERETYITNNHIILTTRLFGIMSETVERGVTVDLVYANLTIDAKQNNRGTIIRSSLAATTTVNSGCLREKIAANRVVPDIMGDLICSELYRLQGIAVEVAATGRGHFAATLNSFIRKVSSSGLKVTQ